MSDNGRNHVERTPEERAKYLESLSEIIEPWVDYTPIFIEHLDDEDPQVRVAAIQCLWHSPDPSLIDHLIQMAENDTSPMVRAQALSGLGIFVYEGLMADFDPDRDAAEGFLDEEEVSDEDFTRVMDFLMGAHADETRTLDERRFALESLGFLYFPEVAELIDEAYNRPEREMKISALFAMGRSGLARWQEILARELYNPDRGLQLEAIRAVGEIGMTKLGKDLWRLTYAEDHEIRLEAIEALGQSGWPGAFERLEDLCLDGDPEIAQVAEEALEEWLMWRETLDEDGLLEDWDDQYD